jgi:hypothetical protein
MSCQCPELLTDQGWLTFCEAPGDHLTALIAAGSDPCPAEWRCPWCGGRIVRTFLEETPAHELSSYVDNRAEFEAVRAGHRCRRASCGWADWIMVRIS